MSQDPLAAPCQASTLDTSVSPTGSLELLSQAEVERLRGIARGALYELFRRCALAVLNCDDTSDSAEEVYKRYPDFDIEIVQRTRGIKLQLRNAPACAFVDGVIISGIREHLFAVLRDIVFVSSELYRPLETGHDADHEDVALHNFEAIRFDQSHADSAEAVKSLCSTCCAMPACCRPGCCRDWWCAGAVTPSVVKNTTTAKRWGISWACADWISAPAVALVP